MPYRNVYEESTRNLLKTEPEKDPKKIAEIYKQQMPGPDKFEETREAVKENERRIEKAKHFKRGIGRGKSILDLP